MGKILELVHPESDRIAQVFYPDDEVEYINYDTPLKSYKDGELKGVFAHYMLQLVHWRESVQIVKEWGRILEDEGLLHIIVPSRRWIARNMLQEKIDPHLAPLLFGEPKAPHRSIFSISDLRAMLDNADLRCVKAKIGKVVTEIAGEPYDAEQLYVVGQKDTYLEDTHETV